MIELVTLVALAVTHPTTSCRHPSWYAESATLSIDAGPVYWASNGYRKLNWMWAEWGVRVTWCASNMRLRIVILSTKDGLQTGVVP